MKLANFRWVFLPYCLDEQDDGRWAVLNRDYKPLGMLTGEYVDYDGHSLWLRGVTAPLPSSHPSYPGVGQPGPA